MPLTKRCDFSLAKCAEESCSVITVPAGYQNVHYNWSDGDAPALPGTSDLGPTFARSRGEYWAAFLLRLIAVRLIKWADVDDVKRAIEELKSVKQAADCGAPVEVGGPAEWLSGIRLRLFNGRDESAGPTEWNIASLFPDIVSHLETLHALDKRAADGQEAKVPKVPKVPKEMEAKPAEDDRRRCAEGLDKAAVYMISILKEWGSLHFQEFVGSREEPGWFSRAAALLGVVGPVRAYEHDLGHFNGLPSKRQPKGPVYRKKEEALEDARLAVRFVQQLLRRLNKGRSEQWVSDFKNFAKCMEENPGEIRDKQVELKAKMRERSLGEIVGTFKQICEPLAPTVAVLLPPLPESERSLKRYRDLREYGAQMRDMQKASAGVQGSLPGYAVAGDFGRGMGYPFLCHLEQAADAGSLFREWLKKATKDGVDRDKVLAQWLFARELGPRKDAPALSEGFNMLVLSTFSGGAVKDGYLPEPLAQYFASESGRWSHLSKLAENLKEVLEVVVIARVGGPEGAVEAYSMTRKGAPPPLLRDVVRPLMEPLEPWGVRYVFAAPAFEQEPAMAPEFSADDGPRGHDGAGRYDANSGH